MAIESRIEADLSGQNTSSQSRIEQILNGEQITPRSRIEQLLQEYNPEDPGSYHKVECTKAQYDNMQSHSSNTIYVVTYPDQSVHFYLGDDEIAGNPTLIEKTITVNGIYDAEDESADGYSIVDVSVAQNYSDVSCTMQEYEAMQSHDNHTIYTVTDGNKVYKYLGDDQIGFGEIPIADRAILSNGRGYECRDELNVSGYNPIDWGKDWELILAFILTTSSLPSAFSNKQYLCGSTAGYPANVCNPFAEFTSSYLTLMYSPDRGSTWPNCGYLAGDDYSTLMNLLDPTNGVVNYLKVKHRAGEQHHYDWYHSKDGRKYSKFYECDRTGYPSRIADSGVHFTFGFGDTKNITQGNGFWMLFDRCALYSEGNLIFGREVVPPSKNYSPAPDDMEIYGIMNSNWWWHDNNAMDYLVRAEDKDNTAPARAAMIAGTIIRVPKGCRAEISCDKSSLQMSCYHLNPDGSGHSVAFPGGWTAQPMVIDNRSGTEDYFLTPHMRKSDDTDFSSSELPTKVIVHYSI